MVRKSKKEDAFYAVMQKFVYGWDFAPWTKDGEQNFMFRDKKEAEKELAELLVDLQEAFERGDMDAPNSEEYTIIKLVVTP